KKVGDKIHLKLEPEDAFGESDPALIMAVPNALLGDHIEEGMKVAGTVLDPTDENIYTVLGPASSGETILDGNHPLAGEALTIDIEILEINKPTKEEIENIESQAASSDLFEISEVTRDQLSH
ncbi:FKBP-type peptidyl-prolyl cis-trans isomerase, partial [Turicimonas muris]